MTSQIVVKLNKRKFKPLIDQINKDNFSGIPKSDSECVGRSLYLLNSLTEKQIEKFGGKTARQYLIESLGTNEDKVLTDCLKDYSEFIKTH